jgi:heme exporter protein C
MQPKHHESLSENVGCHAHARVGIRETTEKRGGMAARARPCYAVLPVLPRAETWLSLLATGLLAAALLAVFLYAPTEKTMQQAQRILYVHVSVAWLALMGFAVVAGAGLAYLLRRDLSCDQWSQAAAELGWLCCGLTLLTGSLWARAAWLTWWTWDPRLTSSFVLWLIYSGYLVARAHVEDPHRRARVGAVLAVVGMLDVPLVVVAAYWFRGMHPAMPGMEPPMRTVLLLSVIGFTTFFVMLFLRRRAQLRLESRIALLEQRIEI